MIDNKLLYFAWNNNATQHYKRGVFKISFDLMSFKTKIQFFGDGVQADNLLQSLTYFQDYLVCLDDGGNVEIMSVN